MRRVNFIRLDRLLRTLSHTAILYAAAGHIVITYPVTGYQLVGTRGKTASTCLSPVLPRFSLRSLVPTDSGPGLGCRSFVLEQYNLLF